MEKNIVTELIDKVLENEELSILMAAGVEIITESKETDDGKIIVTFKSKNPVQIIRHDNGEITVMELGKKAKWQEYIEE